MANLRALQHSLQQRLVQRTYIQGLLAKHTGKRADINVCRSSAQKSFGVEGYIPTAQSDPDMVLACAGRRRMRLRS